MSRFLNAAELQALHRVQLEMLLEFDRICRLLTLRYQLAAGTLLGAVRHGGFIPWDDDVDVAMPRRDFQRFLREAPGVLGSAYFLQHRRSDAGFTALYAKLRRNGSAFREVLRADDACHHGIYIDIFPFDAVAPLRWWGRLHLLCLSALQLLQRFASHGARGRLSPSRPLWQRMLGPIAYRLAAAMPENWLLALQERCIRLLENVSTGHVVCLVMLGLEQLKTLTLARPSSELEDNILLTFEGHDFPAPAAFDTTLTRLYGDYRRLPSPEKRRPPHPVTDFELPDADIP